jgi:hypothetical protein
MGDAGVESEPRLFGDIGDINKYAVIDCLLPCIDVNGISKKLLE